MLISDVLGQRAGEPMPITIESLVTPVGNLALFGSFFSAKTTGQLFWAANGATIRAAAKE